MSLRIRTTSARLSSAPSSSLLLRHSPRLATSSYCCCRLRPIRRDGRRAHTPRRYSTASSATGDAARPVQGPSAANWNQFIAKPAESAAAAASADTAGSFTFTLAVKDNIATTAATTTTCASGMLEGYVSPFEATVVTQLRARGARVVGKTNLDEFGMGSHSLFSHWGRVAAEGEHGGGKAALSVGGSSGGSAVAVRLGDADVALGTDTGGSVRLPAAYGAIVGFKPSYGMLSRFGVVPYANSLDTVGLLAPEVGPIRQLIVGGSQGLWRDADNGRDPTSLTSTTRLRLAAQREGYGSEAEDAGSATADAARPLRGLAFGIPLEYNIAELDPRIRTAWVEAAERLRRLGATVAAVSLPSTRHALSTYYVLAPAEAASNLARYDGVRYGRVAVQPGGAPGDALQETAKGTPKGRTDEVLYERVRGAGFGREVQRRILLGAYVLSATARDNYFLQAQRVRRLVVRDFDAVFRLANPLRDHEGAPDRAGSAKEGVYDGDDSRQHDKIDLSDLPEGLPLADKRGPAKVDFLLCPTAPTPAPQLADVEAAPSAVDAYINDVFTVPASLAGLPAISIPAPPVRCSSSSAETTAFCPGLQLIGQFWDDARLLRAAQTVMEASFERPEDRDALARHRQTGIAER